MARTRAFRSRYSKRAALEVLRGRPARRRGPTPAELANECRFFDELAELMEEAVLVDRCELVPEVVEDEQVREVVRLGMELW